MGLQSLKWSVSTIIQKMISLPTITLNPEEASKFADLMFDQSVLKNSAQMVKMSTNTKRLRGLGMSSSDILHPSATFSSSDYVTELALHTDTLTSHEMRAAIAIFDSDLEDLNIGSAQQFKTQVLGMVAKKLAVELDKAYWIADSHSYSGFAATDIKSLFDGWRYRLDHSQSGETYANGVTGGTVILDASNTVTARADDFALTTSQKVVETDSSAPYEQEYKLALMLQSMPSEYKMGGLNKLRFFMNDHQYGDYVEAVSKRGTIGGDAAIFGGGQMTFGGVPIVQVPLMPRTMEIYSGDVQKENYDASNGDLTDVVLTHEENFVIGMQLDMQIETERRPSDRATYWFFTIRPAVAIEDVHAAVLLKRVK